jgi:hypothetical protein
MTLAETLLQKLADWKPAGAGRQVLTTRDEAGGWSALAHVERCDGLGCQLWELTLRRSAATPGPTLRQWAESLPGKVTGLLEPLTVYEIDDRRNEALLRSHQPQAKGDQRNYYEILLRGNGQAVIRRFQGSVQAGTHREQVAYTLTLEGLAKLINDLTGN